MNQDGTTEKKWAFLELLNDPEIFREIRLCHFVAVINV